MNVAIHQRAVDTGAQVECDFLFSGIRLALTLQGFDSPHNPTLLIQTTMIKTFEHVVDDGSLKFMIH